MRILDIHLGVRKLWDPFFNDFSMVRRGTYLSILIICYFTCHHLPSQFSTILFGAMPRRSTRSWLLSSLTVCRDRARRLFITDHVGQDAQWMEARWELLNLGSQDLTEGRDRYQEVKWTWCFDLTRIVPTTVLKYLLFYGRSRSIVNKSKHQIWEGCIWSKPKSA